MVDNSQHATGLVSQAEYARHRKVHRSYINRLAQRGILVMRGKMVDVAASDAVLDDKPVDFEPQPPAPAPPVRPVTDSPAGQQPASFSQARTVDMVYRARLRKLEFEARDAKLIEAAVVTERWSAILVALKERVLAVPDKMACELAALSDEHQVRSALKREMDLVLKTLNQEVRYAN